MADKKISRREFIATTGAVVGGLGVTAVSPRRARAGNSDDYQVVVLGGGFAGVTAARELVKKGYRVALLEARSRLGGRTFTAYVGGHHVELGGFWVHWTQPYVWAEINRYGLEVEETPGANPERFFFSVDGKPVELPVSPGGSGTNTGFEKLFAVARQIWERPWDQSFRWKELAAADTRSVAEALRDSDLTAEEKGFVDGVVGVMVHNTVDQASFVEIARWYAAANWSYRTIGDATGRYALKKGTIALIEAMLEDASPDVQLSTVVTRVEQRDNGVRVFTEDGRRLDTGAVVVTVPMNVIGDIEFEPALSDIKMAGYREKHAGEGVKAYMEVEGKWGPLAALAPSRNPLCYITTYKELENSTIILGFGSSARRLDPNDTKGAQEALSMMLPDVKVINSVGHNWVLDAFAQGTYCNYRPGQLARFGKEMTRREGRVFMGSGDHGEGWRGFIDGAIGRGLEVAQEADRFLSAKA